MSVLKALVDAMNSGEIEVRVARQLPDRGLQML